MHDYMSVCASVCVIREHDKRMTLIQFSYKNGKKMKANKVDA